MSTDDDDDVAKLRRFTLLIALALFIYAVSGAKLDLDGEFRPLGIPLKIQRADLLGYGLEAVSVYATLRYCLLALILAESPIKARRRLRGGLLATWRDVQVGSEFLTTFREDLNKYYPPYARWSAAAGTKIFHGEQRDRFRTEPPTVPLPVRIVGQIHNFDYWLPVLANLVALSAYAAKHLALI